MINEDVKNTRVLLLDSQQKRGSKVLERLKNLAVRNVIHVQQSKALLQQLEKHDSQMVVIALAEESDHSTLLNSVSLICELKPIPIMMFAPKRTSECAAIAVEKGVTMFVAEEIDAERIVNRLSVIEAQFERTRSLRSRLKAAEGKLGETKIIARAKALLIQHDKLTEDQAHRALHRISMQQNYRLVEVATRIIDAHSALD